jgi:3-hydroxyisobutyrate dehydrogenase-like beta-hydroxyacid dehydrogenase
MAANASASNKTTVGVIGAGRMGAPIIGHLAKKGFDTWACDLDAGKQKLVTDHGAKWAAGPAELARTCEFILICVGFDREVRELLADDGPLRGAKAGSIVAILSTVVPETVQQLAEQLSPRDVHVVDSTVCRGGWAADSGTLLSFVGGSPAVVERLTPVLKAYSADVVHTGGVGTAQVAKAVNNMILWACLVADHEGLALAQRYGADIEALRKALLISSCVNGPLEKWGKQSMAWADDDMAIVSEMAMTAGISLPQAGINRELCRAMKPRRYQLDQYGK